MLQNAIHEYTQYHVSFCGIGNESAPYIRRILKFDIKENGYE